MISVESIDIGSGQVRSAVLVLNAKDGQFITQANGGATPILGQFDKIKISYTDDASPTNTYSAVYEVDKLVPIEDNQVGTRLEVHLLGQERHVQVRNFAKQFQRASGFDVVKDLADRYNNNKGSAQAQITKHDDATFNTLPRWTANDYDFNFAEFPIYDGMMQVIDKLGTSVSNGGAADFFELYFQDDPLDTTKIQLKAFSSGSLPVSPITISSSLNVNVGETEAGIESIVGTNILAWGGIDQGSLPVAFSIFRGIIEGFLLYPAWISGVTYPQNAIVSFDPGTGSVVYRSSISNNTSTPPTNWTQIFPYTLIGSTNYSDYTVDKAGPWKNSGSNPTAVGGFGRGCWDSNLVIVDGTYFRTWVDTRKNTSTTIPTNHKMLDNGGPPNAVLYRGYRVLVDTALGAVGGDFALNGGKDRFGNLYANGLVVHNGGQFTGSSAYKNWDCMITTTSPALGFATTSVNNFQCAVRDEGKVYEWTSPNWADRHLTSMANDCFHTYFATTNDAGVDSTPKSGGGTYGDTSAINISYKYTPWDPLVNNQRNNSNYYEIGWWANFAFPYPLTKDNAITEEVGELYGGNEKSSPEPVTLDSLNMHLTHTGNTGFNAVDSEDLGPLTALSFMMKIQWLDRSGIPMLAGNFKFRATFYDTSGNVAIQDFVIPFNNMWEDILLPLNQFKIYRARIPRRWGLISSVIPVSQLEILNVFEWRNIKQVSIQLQEVYDDEGRYFPEGSRINNDVLTTGIGEATISGWIDCWRFVKPLLASSGVESTRDIEPVFLQRQNISNYSQLKNDVLSMRQIYNFQHKEFDITTTGRCDIAFGDSFYYNNARLISDADNGANTIKLVAKKISYKIDKTPGGPGGFTRTISGVKRFGP